MVVPGTNAESWSSRKESSSTNEVPAAKPCTSTSASGVPTTTKTTTAKSSTTAVRSSPRNGTERHGCDANYQTDYLFNFHVLSSVAPVSQPLRIRGILR